jgi:predicted PurR-regulated permease PerM
MNGSGMRKLVFLGLFLGLFILVARIFYPFLTIILWSGLIYAFLYKMYARAATRRDGTRRRDAARNLLAGAFALGSVALIVLPSSFLAPAVIGQGSELAGAARKSIEQNPGILDLSPESPIGGLAYRLSGGQLDLSKVDLALEAKRFLSGKSIQILGFSGKVLKDLAGMLFNLAFMVFTLYFFFIDGENLARTFVSAIPIDKAYTRLFLRKLRDTGKQLLLGLFLVALFQATMLFIICLVMGVKGSLVIASLAVFAAFIPMVGTALVWIPVAAGIALGGNVPQAILFVALSAIFVSSLDNFIRPILLHDRLMIHPLLIFFAIIGGLSMFGFNGVVLGPLILMLFFTAAELYDQAFDPPNESRTKRELDARGGVEARETAPGQETSKGD